MTLATRNAEALIDRIYEAAAFPDLWPEVLEGLAHAGNAAGAILLANSADRWSGTWAGSVSSPSIAPATDALLNSDIPKRTQATPILLAWDSPGFASTSEGFSPEEWEADPLTVEWCKPWRF